MESRIKDRETPKVFTPFTLEIDVDNRDELNYLWNLFNMAVTKVEVLESRHFNTDKVWNEKHEIWGKLNSK